MSRTLIVVAALCLVLGCRGRESAKKATSPEAVLSPEVAVTLLMDKNPKDGIVCLDATASDGARLAVGRLSSSQPEHEASKFYFDVFDSGTDIITGQRRVKVNRTYFTDPAAAVQAATQMGARQFQVCKFGEL